MAADSFPGARAPVEIVELALKRCRAISAYESAASSPHLETALQELAGIINHLSGNHQCWWLVPETLTFALTADTWTYDLSNALGVNYPHDGVQWVVQAWVRATDDTGARTPVRIVRRDEFELLPTGDGGRPCQAYIDRSTNKQLQIDHSPTDTDPGLTMGLVVQNYAPNVVAEHGINPTKFGPAWDRYLSLALALSIGDGLVTSIEVERLDRWRIEVDDLFADLVGGDARQRESGPPVCEPHWF